jgi:hypothetical protein
VLNAASPTVFFLSENTMKPLLIKDLPLNEELDRMATDRVRGGYAANAFRNGTYDIQDGATGLAGPTSFGAGFGIVQLHLYMV